MSLLVGLLYANQKHILQVLLDAGRDDIIIYNLMQLYLLSAFLSDNYIMDQDDAGAEIKLAWIKLLASLASAAQIIPTFYMIPLTVPWHNLISSTPS